MKKTKTHADRRKRLCFTYYDRKPGENCQGLQRPVLEKNNLIGSTAAPGGRLGRGHSLSEYIRPVPPLPKGTLTGGAAKSRPQDCDRIPGLCPGGGSFSALRKTFLTNLPSGSEATRQICAARRQRASNSRKWPQPLSGSVSAVSFCPGRPRGRQGRSAAPVPCPPAQSGPSPIRSPDQRPSAQRWRSAQSAVPSPRNHGSCG